MFVLQEKASFELLLCFSEETFVTEKNICMNCLSVGHKSSSCPSTYTCRICKQRHHTLLHAPKLSSNVTSINQLSDTDGQYFILLATALIHTDVKGVKVQLRALIDQGSQVSFITTYAANRLGLKRKPGGPAVKFVGVGDLVKTNGTAELIFSSQFKSDYKCRVSVTVLDKITDQLPSEFIKIKLPQDWKNLELADPEFYKPGSIDILLGAEVVSEIIEDGLLRLTDHKVIAQKSTIGWLLSGKVELTNPVPTLVTGNLSESGEDVQIVNNQMQAFWEIEDIGPTNILDPDDQICEEYYDRTHYRDEVERFVVRLPFKPGFVDYIRLGNSRNIDISNWLHK